MTPKPIGITGAIAAGKDTFADALAAARPGGYLKYSLAAPMKRIAEEIFGFTREQLTDHDLKETVDDYWDITPRRFLQIMGTEMFRDCFRDDVWLKLAERRMRDIAPARMVVADVRFPNEAEFVRNLGGVVVKIIRPSVDSPSSASAHSSEAGLPPELVDHVVRNDVTLDEFQKMAAEIWLPLLEEELK